MDNMLFESCVFGTKLSKPDVEYALDVRDAQPEHFDGIDSVIHLAGMSNDPAGDLNPEATYEINHRASAAGREWQRTLVSGDSSSRRRVPPTARTVTTYSTRMPSSFPSHRTASQRSSSSKTLPPWPTTISRRPICATPRRMAPPSVSAVTLWSTTSPGSR